MEILQVLYDGIPKTQQEANCENLLQAKLLQRCIWERPKKVSGIYHLDDKTFEDGIVEFKNNNLSILTSTIFNLADMDKSKQQDLLKQAEEEANKTDINDQSKYLADQKVEVLKTLN